MTAPPSRVHLFVLTGHSVGEEAVLETELLLGRLPECDLTLHDQGVSRKHARVVRMADGIYVEDLGSANGTRMHGQRVQRARLEDGSVFSIGPVELRVRIEARAQLPERQEAVPEVQRRVRPQTESPASVKATPRAGQDDPHRHPSGILRYSEPRQRGFHAEDLSQRGPIQRLLIFLFALAVAAGLFYLAFAATS